MAIQEHRIFFDDDDPIRIQKIGTWYFYHSSATAQGFGGIGFLVSPQAFSTVDFIKSISPRILHIQLSSLDHSNQFKTNLINVYSPTSSAPIELVDDFYNTLASTVSDIPIRQLCIPLGDFNAILPRNDLWSSKKDKTNRNTELFVDFLECNSFISGTSLFRKKKHQYTTFFGTKNRRVELDHILVRSKWISSIKDYETANPTSVSSDHAAVIARFKFTLSSKSSKRSVQKDWGSLNDEGVINKFSEHVLSCLPTENSIEDINVFYNTFISNVQDAKQMYLKDKPLTRNRCPWADNEIKVLRSKLSTTKNRARRYKSASAHLESNQLSLHLAELYLKKQEEYYNSLCQNIKNLSGDNKYRQVWQTINLLTGRKARKNGTISANSPSERLEKWESHFKRLLASAPSDLNNVPLLDPIFVDLEYDTNDITVDEFINARKYMSQNKALGLDETCVQLMKIPALVPIFVKIMNFTLHNGYPPDQWLTSLLIPIHKKGEISDCNNYRGIALMSIAAKLFNRILLMRIRSVLDDHLRTNQNGFRPDRSTTQQILCLRRIIEGCKTMRDHKLLAIFIDFKKAFDSVTWTSILSILLAYGIPPLLVNAVLALYKGAKAQVFTSDGTSDPFSLTTGVLQGDTLAPYLFVIVVDYVMRKAVVDDSLGFQYQKKRSSRYPAKFITDTDFADDIAILSSTLENGQILLSAIEREAAKAGLIINRKKTEFLTVGDIEIPKDSLVVSDGPIKQVDDFKYLGSWLMCSRKDFEGRKAVAWKAATRMAKIWKSNLSRKCKINIFTSTVESVLLYGAETWSLTVTLNKRLDGCYTKLLRYALRYRWEDKFTNLILYDTLPRVSEKVRFAGHCFRSPQLVSDLLFWKPSGKFRSGQGSRRTYPQVLSLDSGRTSSELMVDMTNRQSWRKQISLS